MTNKRYDQLIADLKSDYRPQREWGSGKGVLMVFGHFVVGVAGGTWALASFYHVTEGLILAYVLAILGAIVHLLFLGRPERAFQMMRHVRTSWVSRGFVGLALFLVGGGLYLALLLLQINGVVLLLAQIVAALGTLVIIGYMGFCYTASKGIPFWHSSLHPVLYIAYAARGGIAGLLVVAAMKEGISIQWLVQVWVIVTAVVTLLFLLELHGALFGGNAAARRAAQDILVGRLAMAFYGGTLAVGLIVPLALIGSSNPESPMIIAIVGLASAAGDFFMKLATVRAGVYLPLTIAVPRQHPRRDTRKFA